MNASINEDGIVGGVSLLAEVGGRCVFLSPWSYGVSNGTDIAPRVSCDGVAMAVTASSGPKSESKPQHLGEKWFHFDTKPGDICSIKPAQA